jgi:hypothetical protein
MRGFIERHANLNSLLFLLLVFELIVWPQGEFPLNDDWSYTKSIMILHKEGIIHIGEWPAMTLWTHLVWGYCFTTVFGFSFLVLRLSTLIAAAIGLCYMYRFIMNVSANRVGAFFISLALLLNPMYFNLANSYMTDTNFITLFVMCCYYAERYFTRRRLIYLLIFAVLSVLITLLRQFGLLLPVCFLVASFFMRERRWLSVAAGVLITAIVLAVFRYYEDYLRTILSPAASYQFSGKMNLLDPEFYKVIAFHWGRRYESSLQLLLFFAFPFLLPFTLHVVKKAPWWLTLLLWIPCLALCWWFQGHHKVLLGNIVEDMSVGAETFYEILVATFKGQKHTYSPFFNGTIMEICRYLFCSVSLLTFLLLLWFGMQKRRWSIFLKPEMVFVLTFIPGYALMLLASISYFDRYHLPLIAVASLIAGFFPGRVNFRWQPVAFTLLLFFYMSVFGTRDYFELNRKKWEAYYYLRNEVEVPKDRINAGFEINCWNEGERTWWINFLVLDGFDYLIQYNPEPGFVQMKAFSFSRWYPYKKDSVVIFRREQPVPEANSDTTKAAE